MKPTITDDQLDQLRDLYARHCECRPLDLTRTKDDHAAIHDCDTGILTDIQIVLGIRFADRRVSPEAVAQARVRCAEYLTYVKNQHGGWSKP